MVTLLMICCLSMQVCCLQHINSSQLLWRDVVVCCCQLMTISLLILCRTHSPRCS